MASARLKSATRIAISATAGVALMAMQLLGGCAALVVAGGETSQAGSSVQRESAQLVDDADLGNRVKAQLIAASSVKAWAIDVSARSGVVSLDGSVNSAHQRGEAERIARDVDGVVSVKNNLTLVLEP